MRHGHQPSIFPHSELISQAPARLMEQKIFIPRNSHTKEKYHSTTKRCLIMFVYGSLFPNRCQEWIEKLFSMKSIMRAFREEEEENGKISSVNEGEREENVFGLNPLEKPIFVTLSLLLLLLLFRRDCKTFFRKLNKG